MNLITTYYITDNEERNNEIKKCLLNNCINKYIDKIYLLNNHIFDLNFINDNKNKIVQYVISNDENYKLKYYDAIKFINENLNDKICILSNSDIYFNNSISKINNKTIYNSFFSLLRYNEDLNGNLNIFTQYDVPRNDSQDCWIFRSPLNINLDKINFSLGTLGCDSVFAYEVYKTGINIYNPSFDIISIHLHNTEFRTYNYDNRIHGKYCFISPTHLFENPIITIIDY